MSERRPELDEDTIDRVADAIEHADTNHSLWLVRLVDGVHTYSVVVGGKAREFTDDDDASASDQAYAFIRKVKRRIQAEAVISALISASQS